MTPNTDSAGPSSPNPGRKEQEHLDGSLGARSGAALHNGRYRLRQKLGQGGMGAVYLADDASLPGRQVAVKENLNTTAATQRLFKREALLLARLRHPNLPQVTDFFVEPDGRQYLVMDYVPGENLGQLLRAARGPLPAAEALAIAEQVMRALAYMHTWRDPESGHVRPVIHRDIKPANIKRTPEGHVVLVDFGIAKLDSGEGEHTALSARAMTPGYAPLEQYSGGTDARSDIYALGATLYALLSGKAPPTATDKAAAGARPAAQLMPGLKGLPLSTAKVIERAMQSSPADRFQTVAEMYQALYGRPLATGANALAAAATAVGGPAAPIARRNPWLAAALAVAVLLLAVGLGWLLFNSGGQGTAGIPLTPVAVVAGGAASDPLTELPAVAPVVALDITEVAANLPTAISAMALTETPAPTNIAIPATLAATGAVKPTASVMPVIAPDDLQAVVDTDETDSLAEGAALIAALLDAIPDTSAPIPTIPTPKATSTPLPTATPLPTETPTPLPPISAAPLSATDQAAVSLHKVDEDPTVAIAEKDSAGETLSPSIAFVSDRSGSTDIYRVNIDGSQLMRLTTDSGREELPTWSPDGSQIVFHSDRTGHFQLYIMNADGTNQRRLITSDAIDESAYWSPAGDKIAFSRVADHDGNNIWHTEVFVANSDGSNANRITFSDGQTDTYGHGCWPSGWTGDSARLLIYCYDGNNSLYMVDVDGTNRETLLPDGEWNSIPTISPDDTKIAFSSYRNGNQDIFVLDLSTGKLTQLTNEQSEDWRPIWSPTGDQILFESDRSGAMQVYQMNADGSNVQMVPADAGKDSHASWRP